MILIQSQTSNDHSDFKRHISKITGKNRVFEIGEIDVSALSASRGSRSPKLKSPARSKCSKSPGENESPRA